MDFWHFRRPDLAELYVKRLLLGAPALALFSPRRTGKTSFLLHDLKRVATSRFFVVYACLWEDKEYPEAVLCEALQTALDELADTLPGRIAKALRTQVRKLALDANLGELGGGGLEVEFADQTHTKPTPIGRLNRLLKLLLSRSGVPVLLLLDEVQHLATQKRFELLVAALRTTLDTNRGRLLAVFTGSSRDRLRRLFQTTRAPLFRFGQEETLPPLGEAFVEFVLQRFEEVTKKPLKPADRKAAHAAFSALNHMPGDFVTLVQELALSNRTDIGAALVHYKGKLYRRANYEGRWRQLKPVDQAVVLLLADSPKPYLKPAR